MINTTEQQIVAQLAENLEKDVRVLTAADLSGLQERQIPTPSVHVIFRGTKVRDTRPDGKAALITEQWMVVACVSDRRRDDAMESITALHDQIATCLMGFYPQGASGPLKLADAPAPGKSENNLYLPVGFVVDGSLQAGNVPAPVVVPVPVPVTPDPEPEPADTTAPVFTSGATATAIDENSGAGQVVYTATTDDSSANLTLSGTDAESFSLDANTGQVTLTENPDYETKASYSFDLTATDAAGNSATQTVTLAVNDLDETPTETPEETSFDPLSVGAPVLMLDASVTGSITASNGSVTQVDNLADANNPFINLSGANMPTTSVNTLNGLNVLAFNLARLELAQTVVCKSLFIVVAEFGGSDFSNDSVTFLTGSGTSDYVMHMSGADYDLSLDGSGSDSGVVTLQDGATGSGENVTVSPFLSDAEELEWNIWQIIYDANSETLVDLIGAFASNNGSTFKLAQIVGYSDRLSEADAALVMAHLSDKWAIV